MILTRPKLTISWYGRWMRTFCRFCIEHAWVHINRWDITMTTMMPRVSDLYQWFSIFGFVLHAMDKPLIIKIGQLHCSCKTFDVDPIQGGAPQLFGYGHPYGYNWAWLVQVQPTQVSFDNPMRGEVADQLNNSLCSVRLSVRFAIRLSWEFYCFK